MARIWKEAYNPQEHVDFMASAWVGGVRGLRLHDPILHQWVYFVHVSGFTFQFHSLEQLRTCLTYFSQKLHPSTRTPGPHLEHYWPHWYERLPLKLFAEPKRQKVVQALAQALREFSDDSPVR